MMRLMFDHDALAQVLWIVWIAHNCQASTLTHRHYAWYPMAHLHKLTCQLHYHVFTQVILYFLWSTWHFTSYGKIPSVTPDNIRHLHNTLEISHSSIAIKWHCCGQYSTSNLLVAPLYVIMNQLLPFYTYEELLDAVIMSLKTLTVNGSKWQALKDLQRYMCLYALCSQRC